jgi:UDP-2,4-diacetamido-2,4,6-trideoxy-beta-L-altropyranose hydrolase
MNIGIRCDSSTEMGIGHVMRCLTLADKLKHQGWNVFFISREKQGSLISYIKSRGYKVYVLPTISNSAKIFGLDIDSLYASWLGVSWQEDAEQTLAVLKKIILQEGNSVIDWLIVDHYGLDSKWESLMRKSVNKIMIIDDLANRTHDCDLLLDQNWYDNMSGRYAGFIPKNCIQLLGPSFALLREQFVDTRKYLQQKDGNINRIFVFFGGSDPTNETEKVLLALKKLNKRNLKIDIVVGEVNPNKEKIASLCTEITGANFYCQVENMAVIMVKADLALGAGGSTSWERCCLGLPTLVTILAENQSDLTRKLETYGAVKCVGEGRELTVNDYCEAIISLTPSKLNNMSKKAATLVDGNGCYRVAGYLIKERNED